MGREKQVNFWLDFDYAYPVSLKTKPNFFVSLHEFVNQAGLFMQPIIEVAKKAPARIVYAEGENDDVLLAVQAVTDRFWASNPLLVTTMRGRLRRPMPP